MVAVRVRNDDEVRIVRGIRNKVRVHIHHDVVHFKADAAVFYKADR